MGEEGKEKKVAREERGEGIGGGEREEAEGREGEGEEVKVD